MGVAHSLPRCRFRFGFGACPRDSLCVRYAAAAAVTPDFAHKDPVIAAAQAKKHILVKKPLATSLADALETQVAAEKAGVILMPDFHNRWNLCFVTSNDSIADGTPGDPHYIYIRHSNTKYVPFKMSRSLELGAPVTVSR